MTNELPEPGEWNLGAQLDAWRALAQIVRDESLSELTIETEGVTLTLKSEVAPALEFMQAAGVAASASVVAHEVTSAPSAATPTASDLIPVVSPMVGVFYRALSPDDPPLVEVGDRLEVGQTVGLVEAMKMFSEITSEVEGTVVEVRTGNAELVETGSVLFLVKP